MEGRRLQFDEDFFSSASNDGDYKRGKGAVNIGGINFTVHENNTWEPQESNSTSNTTDGETQ